MAANKKPLLGPISSIRLFVDDLEQAHNFYHKQLGFEEILADDEVMIFDAYGIDLMVESIDIKDDAEKGMIGRFTGVSFVVEDCVATYETLKNRGVEFIDSPIEEGWGGVIAYFCDPAGNVLTLVQYPHESDEDDMENEA